MWLGVPKKRRSPGAGGVPVGRWGPVLYWVWAVRGMVMPAVV
jgi:hypothetical protein